MKEKILQELKKRAAKSGCSERTIQTYVENISLPEDESTLTDDFYNGHVAILTTIGGQISRHVAEQVDEFKKNFKPEPQKTIQPGNSPDAIQKLEATVQALQARLDQEAKDRARAEKFAAADRLMTEQGATNKTVRELIMANVEIKDDDTAEIIATKGKTLYDAKYTELYGSGSAPRVSGNSAAGSPPDFDELKTMYRKRGLLAGETNSN